MFRQKANEKNVFGGKRRRRRGKGTTAKGWVPSWFPLRSNAGLGRATMQLNLTLSELSYSNRFVFFLFFFFETKREFLCRSQSAPCIYAFPLHRHGYVYKASRLDSWKEIEFRRRERERVLFNRDCCDCCALHARDIQCWNSVVSSFFLRGTGGGNFSLFIATIAHLLCPRPLFPYRRCRRIFRTSFDLRRKGSSFFDIITFYWNVLVE